MIWLLTQTVNQIPEFRTALTDEGLGIYNQMHPAYTVFDQDSKTFSGIWTEFNTDYNKFLKAYEKDAATFSSSMKFAPKPNRPPNSFDISAVCDGYHVGGKCQEEFGHCDKYIIY